MNKVGMGACIGRGFDSLRLHNINLQIRKYFRIFAIRSVWLADNREFTHQPGEEPTPLAGVSCEVGFLLKNRDIQ